MSLLGERTLIGLLSDLDAVEVLAREGLNILVVPTESLRPVIDWTMAYYLQSIKAPTTAALKERWGDLLTDHDIDVDDPPEESIEWAMDDLYSAYVRQMAGQFSRRMATEITSANPEDRVAVLGELSNELSSIVMDLQPRTSQVDMRASGDRILLAYDEAVLNAGQVKGLAFGLPLIDQHTGGIHDGEMAVVAGAAKTGKSWFMDLVAYNEWDRGQSPALFTMENSIEMTEMRIACIALHISIQEMQNGTLSPVDYNRLREWCNDVLKVAPNPLFIFNPAVVQRTPHAVVQAARANNADSIILDQLTFMETTQNKRDQSRSYELRDILHDLKGLVSTGRHRLPLLMAHQIKREGIKAAEKSGVLKMTDLADSSEVERSVDWGFALYQSDDDREVGAMQLQGVAARRQALRSFDLIWQIEVGVVGVRNEVEIP